MKGKLLQTAGIIGFVIGSIVPTAYAQTTANGPYYATPAWDQKLQCDTLAMCPRFIVLANWNNEAVLDRESGLVWQRTAIGPSARNQAVFACWSAATGGRRGWRLPRLDELMTLGDPANPPLPAGQPFSGVFVKASGRSTSFRRSAPWVPAPVRLSSSSRETRDWVCLPAFS